MPPDYPLFEVQLCWPEHKVATYDCAVQNHLVSTETLMVQRTDSYAYSKVHHRLVTAWKEWEWDARGRKSTN